MRKLMLIGRVAAGKTTLTQALRGEEIKYYKTQYVYYHDTVIDTPGEYTERRETSGALALYAYEADVVGLVLSANEPYSIFSPCLTSMVNREVIGIISGIDKPDANVERVTRWLKLAGCKKIFPVCAITGQGLRELIEYLETDEERERRLQLEEKEKAKKTAAKPRAKKSTAKNVAQRRRRTLRYISGLRTLSYSRYNSGRQNVGTRYGLGIYSVCKEK